MVSYYLIDSTSPEDSRCYIARYPDLKRALGADIAAAKEHYNTIGKKEGRVFGCNATLSEFEGTFVKSMNTPIYFVRGAKALHVESCRPCGSMKSVCDGDYRVIELSASELEPSIINTRKFDCHSDAPELWEGFMFINHKKSINALISADEPVRINILMTGVGKDLTGGPLSIMHFANELLLNGFNIRWINVDGHGLKGEELVKHTREYQYLSEFANRVEFIFDGMNYRLEAVKCNPDDLFMATLYFTAPIAHHTIKSNPFTQRNFIYFIQDYEPIFFPHGSDYIEALESYRFPHFAIYSTPFLLKWFQRSRSGQFEFLGTQQACDLSFAAKPAIKVWPSLNANSYNASRERILVAYMRAHSDRNAYGLTVDSLSAAICQNVFKGRWKFIGVGALNDYFINIGRHCGKGAIVNVYKNIPEPEYHKLLINGDIGFSLMISPHPSLPPFDFAAAGLIAVTNSFQTKTKHMFLNISSNFVVAKPYLSDITKALKVATIRSMDYSSRIKGMENFQWERNWRGPECYGEILMKKIKHWSTLKRSLWEADSYDYPSLH